MMIQECKKSLPFIGTKFENWIWNLVIWPIALYVLCKEVKLENDLKTISWCVSNWKIVTWKNEVQTRLYAKEVVNLNLKIALKMWIKMTYSYYSSCIENSKQTFYLSYKRVWINIQEVQLGVLKAPTVQFHLYCAHSKILQVSKYFLIQLFRRVKGYCLSL